VASSASTTEK